MSYKKQWLLIVVGVLVVMYMLYEINHLEVGNPESSLVTISETTDEVVGFSDSLERTAYLRYISSTISKKELTRQRYSHLMGLYDDALNAEADHLNDEKKAELAKKSSKVLRDLNK